MQDKNKFKSSFLIVFDNTLKYTWIASLIIITNFAIITKKINEFNLNIDINLFLIILLFIFIICIFIYNLIIWRISRFEIKEKVIVIYKNIFIKDKKEFLIDNISNICISQNVFERIFKLKRIRIFENQKNKLFCDFNVVLTNKNFNCYLIPFFFLVFSFKSLSKLFSIPVTPLFSPFTYPVICGASWKISYLWVL